MSLIDVNVLGSPWLLLVVFALVVVGAVVQAGLGMGFGLVAAPLMAMIDPVLVPVPALFMGMLSSVGTAYIGRKDIQWDEVGVGVAGRIGGVVAATWVLSLIVDHNAFLLIFGIMVGSGVLLSVSGLRLPFNGSMLFCMGNLSGFMATITSIGAPPMALLYQGRQARQARPTLCAVFAFGGLASLIALYASGWAGWPETVAAMMLVPPMAIGVLIATRFRGQFDRRYRVALLTISGVSALVLIWRGLF